MANLHDPGVIMTRTPLRVSFAGGGTDLAEFYERESGAESSRTLTSTPGTISATASASWRIW